MPSRTPTCFSRELAIPLATSLALLAVWEALVHAGFLRGFLSATDKYSEHAHRPCCWRRVVAPRGHDPGAAYRFFSNGVDTGHCARPRHGLVDGNANGRRPACETFVSHPKHCIFSCGHFLSRP